MKNRFAQDIHVVNVGSSTFMANLEDAFAGTVTTDVVNLSNYDRCTWIIGKGAGVTGTTVVTVQSCDNTTPSTTTAIAFDYWTCVSGDTFGDMATATTAGFTTTAGANQIYLVEINAAELSGTNKYARLVLTESANDPCDGFVTCILSNPRYMHEAKQTAIV